MTDPDDLSECRFDRPCVACQEEGDRLEREFWDRVKAGKFDPQGYTPAERRAQTKRLQQEGRLF